MVYCNKSNQIAKILEAAAASTTNTLEFNIPTLYSQKDDLQKEELILANFCLPKLYYTGRALYLAA